MPNIFTYPNAKSVVISGDIHGDFELLVFKMCEQYDMRDTLVIVAGDCGLGFNAEGYYEQVFRRIQKRLTTHNCWIAMVRGNHDDPSYFLEQKIHHERFRTIPDYSVISILGHQILCVGGAISIDRSWRLAEMQRHPGKLYYWQNEPVHYDMSLMDEITQTGILIDTVITHTAPSFCELQTKDGLATWAAHDPELLQDCDYERGQMDMLLRHLQNDHHPVRHWFYAHFHQSWYGEKDGISFRMLDIMELYEFLNNTPSNLVR